MTIPTNSYHHRLFLSAILTALSVAVGYALMWIPNIEFITATIFISGYVTGRLNGLWIGFSAALIYFTFNPQGASPLPLLLAQMAAMGLAGFCGGVLKKCLWLAYGKWKVALLFGGVGLLLTVFYDMLTNAATAFMIAQGDWQKMVSVFIAGYFFSLVHLIFNVIGFAGLVPMILIRLERLRPFDVRHN